MTQFINVKQLCEEYGFSASFLYKMTAARRIPFYQPTGGRIYFDRNEIEAYIRHGKKEVVNTNETIILKRNKK